MAEELKKTSEAQIVVAIDCLARALESGSIAPEELRQRISKTRARLREAPPPESDSIELSEEELTSRVDALIASSADIWLREGSAFFDRIEKFGLKGIPLERVGQIINLRLVELLEQNADIDSIARLVTLLHDDFPESLGGGGFNGMFDVPQIREMLLKRLLKESSSPNFNIINDDPQNNDSWIPSNRTLQYIDYRLRVAYHFSPLNILKREADDRGDLDFDVENVVLNSQKLVELYQGHLKALIDQM